MSPGLWAAAGVAVLELDSTMAVQSMVSRPVVLGPLLGALYGQAGLGAVLGALWELASLDALPIGGSLPINATAAAGASLLLSLGGGLAPEAAFPCGVAAGWTHQRLEGFLRRRRAACARRCERRISEGGAPGLGASLAAELAKQALMTFMVLAAVVIARPWLSAAWTTSPESLRGCLRFALEALPWMALAALLHSLRIAA
ncbi:MAG: PTS sugar transporter subunit IIC [Elusimicrobia bacterium]|nr:PTS sugar transporter subunit IIC [Elusimicrobiota bacterium]MDE2236298.1 PTS sugar transporter subunit IIC [Elusimicrobiota bacterium]MDE2424407.1 PTS sugar transporter subunit IIC [Elusimicrobiota bacterium]